MGDYGQKLVFVRRFARGFTAADGYVLRRGLTTRQKGEITRYFTRLAELTASPHDILPLPKNKEILREARVFANQVGYPKLKYIFVPKIGPNKKKPLYDRNRPKNSRFYLIDNKGRRYYNIPASVFKDIDLDGTDEIEEVISEYTDDASFYIIRAGDSYVLSSGGDAEAVSEKIATLAKNYSSDIFNPNDKNSSYFGNWFNGVIGFTSEKAGIEVIAGLDKKRREYLAGKGKSAIRYRRLRNGKIAGFGDGQRVTPIGPLEYRYRRGK